MNESSRTSGGRGPFDPERFAVDTSHALEFTDWAFASLEDRVSAIEEIIAARWPRSMFLRRRLARALRESVAITAWAAPGFAERREEWVGEMLVQESLRGRPRGGA